MAEAAALPQVDTKEKTGIAEAFSNLKEKIMPSDKSATQVAGRGVSAAGTGVEKLTDSVVAPLMSSLLGGDFILTQLVSGMSSAISSSLKGIGAFMESRESKKVQSSPAATPMANPTAAPSSSTPSTSSGQSSTGEEGPGPIATLKHPEMRRVPRIPFIVRNMAMLSSRVSDMVSKQGGGGDELQETLEQQTGQFQEITDGNTEREMEQQEMQFDRLIAYEEENQPNLLERRRDRETQEKLLEEQKKQTGLLEEGNKLEAKASKEGGGIGEMISNVLGSLGGAGAVVMSGIGGMLGAGAGAALGGIARLLGRIPIIGIVISAIGGIIDAFEEFTESGNIWKAIMAGIEGFADSLIKIFTLGFLDLEKVQNWVDEKFGWALDYLFGAIDKTLEFFTDTIPYWWNKTVSFITDAFEWLSNFISNAASGIKDAAKFAFDYSPLVIAFRLLKKFFDAIPDAVKNILKSALVNSPLGAMMPQSLRNKLLGEETGVESAPLTPEQARDAYRRRSTPQNYNREEEKRIMEEAERNMQSSTEPSTMPTPESRAAEVAEENRIANTPQTFTPDTPPPRPDVNETRAAVGPSSFSEEEKLAGALAEDNLSPDQEKSIAQLLGGAGEEGIKRATERATGMEEGMSMINQIQGEVDRKQQSNIMTNSQQVVNAQRYENHDAPLNPRKEDYAAGALNRDTSY